MGDGAVIETEKNPDVSLEDDLKVVEKAAREKISLNYYNNSDKEHVDKLLESFTKALESHPEGRGEFLEIAINGSLEGVSGETMIRGGNRSLVDKRKRLLDLYVENPDLARELVKSKIVGVHGSTSGSLPGVFERGLVPLKKRRDEGEMIMGGERFMGNENINTTTSFVEWDWASVVDRFGYLGDKKSKSVESLNEEIREAERVIEIVKDQAGEDHYLIQGARAAIEENKAVVEFLKKEPENEEERFLQKMIKLNFPVMYAVNLDGIDMKERIVIPHSQIPNEFVVIGGTSMDNLKLIFVPADRISLVEGLIKERNLDIKVFSLEQIL